MYNSRMIGRLCQVALLCCAPVAVFSATVTLTWDHPDQRVDGSPLPIEEIQNTMLFWRNDTCDAQQLLAAPSEQTAIVPSPLNEYVTPDLSEGVWCFTARTIDTAGLTSDPSNVASKEILPKPLSPENLVTVDIEFVYSIRQTRDTISLVPLGTISSGVNCDPNVFVADSNGVLAYRVPRESVEWASDARAEVVFARCQ